jgi:hypothetical protein
MGAACASDEGYEFGDLIQGLVVDSNNNGGPAGFTFHEPWAAGFENAPPGLETSVADDVHVIIEAFDETSGNITGRLARYDSTTIPRVKIDAVRGVYHVGFDGNALVEGNAYRVRVDVAGVELGYAEINALYVPHFRGKFLRFNFRIERIAVDPDLDGTIEARDNCPRLSNADQLDNDGDGKGDACECDNVSCTPRNVCEQSASCDAATGNCVYVAQADGLACGDGDACNGVETCQSGQCTSGQAPSCDDGNECTTDSCDAALGCVHEDAQCDRVVTDHSPGLWLRADDLNAQDGAQIAEWPAAITDLASASQTSSGMRPIYRASSINGRPALEFDGSNDRLDLSANVFGTANLPLTMFAVLRTADTHGHVFGTGSSDSGFLSTFGNAMTINNGAPSVKANADSFGLHLPSPAAANNNQARIISAVARGGANQLYVDCEARGTSPVQLTSYGYIKSTIGSSDGMDRGFTQDPFSGAIAELIVLPGALSYGERTAIEQYLADKYGITCVPPPAPAPAQSLSDTAAAFFRMEEAGASGRADVTGGTDLLASPANAAGYASVGAIVNRGTSINGQNGYSLRRASSSALDHHGGSFTWAGWVSFTSFYDWQTIAGKWSDSNSNREYRIFYNGDAGQIEFVVSRDGLASNLGSVRHPRTIALNTYYFVEAWHDASADTINLRVGTQSSRGDAISSEWPHGVYVGGADLNVGAHNNTADDRLHGVIDALGFWRRELSEAERFRLWNQGTGFEPGILHPSEVPGCDGVPGSGATIDACGVCGGGGSSCEHQAVIASGLSLWLRAHDLHLSEGTEVAAWGTATQSDVSRRPLFRNSGLNGLAALQLDGVNDQLLLPTNLFSSSSFPVSVFVVMSTVDTSAHVLGTGSSSSGFLTSYGGGITVNVGAPVIKANSNSSGLHLASSQRIDDGAGHFIAAIAQSGTSSIRVDCVARGTSSASTNAYTYTRSTIGSSDGSVTGAAADPFAGRISEIIVYNRALSVVERAGIERYLSQKYGIAIGLCP